MEIKKIYYNKNQSIHDIGNSKGIVIPKKYRKDSKEVEIVIGETGKGNTVMIVKLDDKNEK